MAIKKVRWADLSISARIDVRNAGTLSELLQAVGEHILETEENGKISDSDTVRKGMDEYVNADATEFKMRLGTNKDSDYNDYIFENPWSLPLFWYILEHNELPNFAAAKQSGLTLSLYYNHYDGDMKGPYLSYLMDKKVYLESRFWWSRAKFVKDRDEKCVVCDAEWSLHAHHWSYMFMGTDYELDNIQAVCSVCHSIVHRLCELDKRGNVKPIAGLVEYMPKVEAFLALREFRSK